MSEEPKKIGKYSVHAVAGSGNTGVVYAGYDPFADRQVAIKVCSVDAHAADGAARLFRKMFFNEAHMAGALDHSNILKVLDAGEEAGEPYIVMEYVSGGRTLRDYCTSERLLPLERVIEIGFKCAKALDYAHRRGIVHRDIKPSNIMLTHEGDVKIGDFGIAQRMQLDITQVLGIVGSPIYMSPEQAREDNVDQRTDLYSLGVVLFELLCGRPPFEAAGFSRLVYQITNEPPPDLISLRPDLPETLSAVVGRALEKDPDARYQSGLEFAIELARIGGKLQPSSNISEDAKFASVRQLSFFNEFSDSEVWEVIRASRWRKFETGEQIITQGTQEQSFYVIVEGVVSVSRNGTVISRLGKGHCVGEMGYLTKMKRTASIVVVEDVTLLEINSTMLERASVTCQLRFNKVFLQTLIERLARTSDELSRRS